MEPTVAIPLPGAITPSELPFQIDTDAISAFLAEVRTALTEQGTKPVSVALVRTEENE